MKKIRMGVTLLTALLAIAPLLVHAEDLSGTISSTYYLSENSRLVGDVQCTVEEAPCIAFDSSGITLSLNGHVIMGTGTRATCPGIVSGQSGIDTGFEDHNQIVGPGIVAGFADAGIVVNGNNSIVGRLVVESNCQDGIAVYGSNNIIVANSVIRSSLDGNFSAGIYVENGTGNVILRNEVIASGPPAAPGVTNSQQTGFGGNGIVINSNNNFIGENNVSGNLGIGIFAYAVEDNDMGTSGNIFRGNSALGNLVSQDIFDNNPPGSNLYDDNLCQISGGTGAPSCAKMPLISGHRNIIEIDPDPKPTPPR